MFLFHNFLVGQGGQGEVKFLKCLLLTLDQSSIVSTIWIHCAELSFQYGPLGEGAKIKTNKC